MPKYENIKPCDSDHPNVEAEGMSRAASRRGDSIGSDGEYRYGKNSPHRKKSSNGGCYIATAVYGSYDAPQVMSLHRFRDENLSKTMLGRLFIRVYYKLSPPIARWLTTAKITNTLAKAVLDKIVRYMDAKKQNK